MKRHYAVLTGKDNSTVIYQVRVRFLSICNSLEHIGPIPPHKPYLETPYSFIDQSESDVDIVDDEL